jgi:hypothetical protein
MNVIGWLVCLVLLQQQPPAAPQPVDPEVRARFSVTVTASETVTARVYEYLQLVARRNTLKSRFGDRGTAAELELVLLFEKHPKMPWSRRDIGSVNLRLSPDDDLARVEYCLRRCREPEPDLVVYTSTLDDFMKKLDAASALLARQYR